MFPNRFAIAALVLACLVAAGAGGYIATRQNALSVAVPTASAAPTAALAPATSTALTSEVAKATAKTEPITASARAEAVPAGAGVKRQVAPSVPARTTKASQTTARGQQPTFDANRSTSGASAPAPATGSATSQLPEAQAPPRQEERVAETPRAPEPPQRSFEELIVSGNSVIGLQTDVAISSDRARVEDRVEGRVARDVRVDGQVAIPAGSRVMGSVVVVDRGGKFKERARLGIRFHALTMPDGTEVPISTETIYRYGEAPGNSTAAKIGGGAVAGAILGAILGGGKGAAVGATTGAGAGTVAVAAGDRSVAIFPAGAEITARILSPVTLTIEK